MLSFEKALYKNAVRNYWRIFSHDGLSPDERAIISNQVDKIINKYGWCIIDTFLGKLKTRLQKNPEYNWDSLVSEQKWFTQRNTMEEAVIDFKELYRETWEKLIYNIGTNWVDYRYGNKLFIYNSKHTKNFNIKSIKDVSIY